MIRSADRTEKVVTIDLGNTAVKCSLIAEGNVLASSSFVGGDAGNIQAFVNKYSPAGAIVCSVREDSAEVVGFLQESLNIDIMLLTNNTPLPIEIGYSTPETLGLDRVAASVGAAIETENALVVDAGSAVTIDLLGDRKFLGGNISPGLRMRFRALNSFTSRLPLLSPMLPIEEFGTNTKSAIETGVIRGLVDEIAAACRRAKSRYSDLIVYLTGGDATFLAPLLRAEGISLKEDHTLLSRGLYEIYKFNIDN